MTINGLHLWLGAPGAIFEMDTLRAGLGGYTPGLAFPQNEPAYVIRDDRNALSFISALAFEYYGRLHNPGTWTLRDCGLMSKYSTLAGSVQYPRLGMLIGDVTYAGHAGSETKVTLNTSVTSIHYDHESGSTTWRTDFVAFDGNAQ
jgi:hypothetical protein